MESQISSMPGVWTRELRRAATVSLVTVRQFETAVFVAVAITTALLLKASWHWPLVHDTPLFTYVAFLMSHGKVPYRDIIEINMPGTYAVNWLAIRVFGTTDQAWRIFDIVLLGVAAIATLRISKPLGLVAGLAASCIVAINHISCGITDVGQRDFIMGVAALASAAALADFLRHRRFPWIFIAGMTSALAGFIKPTGIGFVVVGIAVLIWHLWPERALAFRAILTYLGGCLLTIGVILLYLWRTGALRPFLNLVLYLWPIYGQTNRVPLAVLADTLWSGIQPVIVLLPAACIGMLANKNWRTSAEQHVLFGGVVWSAVSFFFQDKGWLYQFDPCLLFLGVWSVFGVLVLLRNPHRLAWRLGALTLVFWLSFQMPQLYQRTTTASYPVASLERLQSEISDLFAHGSERSVQCMTANASGCINALYHLHVVQATGFIYDYYLFQSPDSPYAQQLRARYLREMNSALPALVVIADDQWPLQQRGYSQLDTWPEFMSFLNMHYHIYKSLEEYRIYVMNTEHITEVR